MLLINLFISFMKKVISKFHVACTFLPFYSKKSIGIHVIPNVNGIIKVVNEIASKLIKRLLLFYWRLLIVIQGYAWQHGHRLFCPPFNERQHIYDRYTKTDRAIF